jgi:hypothetical protein
VLESGGLILLALESGGLILLPLKILGIRNLLFSNFWVYEISKFSLLVLSFKLYILAFKIYIFNPQLLHIINIKNSLVLKFSNFNFQIF